MSGKQTYLRVEKEINLLPSNYALTKQLCDPSRFCRILILDGKYIKVAGLNKNRPPFLYGIDYSTHDIPLGELYLAEDYLAFLDFFLKLRDLDYYPGIVVADDRTGLKQALNKTFPLAKLQLCHNHYLENIRQKLKVRSDDRYVEFFNALRWQVFIQGKDQYLIETAWREVWKQYAKDSPLIQDILRDIQRMKTELFNYLGVKGCPNNTNLIELYNSHLNGRLKTIKGFQNLESASRWLNAWTIRRRTKPLTDCEKKFKHLNHHASLGLTIKKQAQWPDILTNLGINKIKFYENGG